MTSVIKSIIRFNTWIHPDMVARFEHEPDVAFTVLEQDDAETAWAAIGRAHGYQIGASRDELHPHWHAGAPLLERAPNLLCVSSNGAGYDTVDIEACTAAGVLVVNQAGSNAQSVAEHTFGLILDLSNRISETDRYMRSLRGSPREAFMGHEISGRTIGLIGIGHVGRRVAAIAKAFDMKVLASDPYIDREEVTARGAKKVELDELLAQSDIVSVHCPRDETTFGMVDARAFGLMKSNAVFITTARGGIHDEAALAETLSSGQLAGAGVDVWAPEPPDLDHPVLKFDNVVATIHTAGVTHEARGRMARNASDQLVGVLGGKRPPRLINPEAWPRFAERYQEIIGIAPRG